MWATVKVPSRARAGRHNPQDDRAKQAGCAPGRLDSDARNVTLMAGRYVVYLFNA